MSEEAGWSIDVEYEQIPGQPYRFKEHITYPSVKDAMKRGEVLKTFAMLTSYHIYDPEGNLWGGYWRDHCL